MLETYGEYFLELVQRIKGKEYCGPVCLLPDVATYFLSDYFRFWIIRGGPGKRESHDYLPLWMVRSSMTSTVSVYVSSPQPTTPAGEAFARGKNFSHGTFTHADFADDPKMLAAVTAVLCRAERQLGLPK